MSARAALVVRAAAAGTLAGLFWLPLGLAPLFPLAMVLAIRALRQAESGDDAARFGLAFAAARYAVASHFLLALLRYSPLAIAFYLLAILFVLPWGFLEGWGSLRMETRWGIPRELGFGMLYALGEWVRSLGDLSLPADQLAHAFGSAPAWLGVGRFVGPFGFTLLVFAVAVLADRAFDARRQPALAATWGALALVAWVGPPLVDLAGREDAAAGATIRVGVVQPAIDVREKLARDRWPGLWKHLENLTVEAARGADLVVWPESARPGPVVWKVGGPFADPEMEALAARVGVPILYGCEIARVEGGHLRALYNGAALARPDGGRPTWYAKQHLLPFAEGVPFARALGLDPATRRRGPGGRDSLVTMLGNFSPGAEPTVFEVGRLRVGVLICFEGLYPGLARAYRNAGANTLVVMSNDAWWGRSLFPKWHARMVAARARENDLPVIRAANSGVSLAVDRRGRSSVSTPYGEVARFRVDVSPATGPAPFYTRHGDLAIAAILALMGLAAVAGLVGKGVDLTRLLDPARKRLSG